MDVTLKPFNFAQAAARAGLGTNGLPLVNAGKQVNGAGFQQQHTQALRAGSESQLQADDMKKQVQMGNPTVSLEETLVARQKARIGVQPTLRVRTKLVLA